jgi:hypothetical protein
MISNPNIYAEAKGLSTTIFGFMDNINLGMKEKNLPRKLNFLPYVTILYKVIIKT